MGRAVRCIFCSGRSSGNQRSAVSQKDATSIPNAIWDNSELFRLQEVISLGKKGLISKLRRGIKKIKSELCIYKNLL
jgi:hypothetical protein